MATDVIESADEPDSDGRCILAGRMTVYIVKKLSLENTSVLMKKGFQNRLGHHSFIYVCIVFTFCAVWSL